MNVLPKLPIKKYVVIGSSALGTRFAKDLDVICLFEDIETECVKDDYITSFEWCGKKVECLLADNQDSLRVILDKYPESAIADYMDLFAIKAGHITFPHKQWDKHIMDYHILRKLVNTDHLYVQAITKLHKKSTEERLGRQKTPRLKGVSKEEFFDDYVVKYYVHDNIHRSVAHRDKPMYEYMQEDTTKVECNKRLWDKFEEEWKIQCVLEEAYVIALERHIIPTLKGGKVGLQGFEAFRWALYRICTTLCSGWFRQYAVDNYFTILNSFNKGFVERFLTNIEKYEPSKQLVDEKG